MIGYGVMLLALLAVLGGLYGKGRSDGHAASDADWQPKLKQAQGERDNAVNANTLLQGAVEKVRGDAAKCTEDVGKLKGVGAEARSAVALAFAERDARQKASEAKVAGYEAGARAAPTGTKEQQCDATTAVLRETSERYRLVLGEPIVPTTAPVPLPVVPSEPVKPAVVAPSSKPAGAVKLPPGVK